MDVEALASLASQKRCCDELLQQVFAKEAFILLSGERGSGRTAVCEQVVNAADNKPGTMTSAAAGDVLPINNRNIALDGNVAGNTYSRVYGTDETVYLTVGVKEMHSGTYYGYINEVDSVVTGIGNANLEVWFESDARDAAEKETHGNVTPLPSHIALSEASNGAYSLYNDKGDIIACVVVGEDAGSTKNLVYAHTASTYRETYNATTDTWTWSRKVISNGQEVILTEVGDGLSELGGMVQHNWYQVKYNAEGNVIDVLPASTALTTGVDYILDYDDLADAVVNEDTVLYYSATPEISTADLKLVGKTLWLDSTATRGFRVADEVNVALIQYNNNVEKTYFETGVTSLKNIVNELNERHSTVSHNYRVSAILDKGVATSIVIYDYNKACDPYTDGNWETEKSGVLDLSSLVFNGGVSGMDVTFTNKTGKVISAAATADVVVRNASGNLVCSLSGVAYGGVGVNGVDTINFNYTGTPTNTGNYTVTLTIHDGTSTYVGTATLGTV